MTDLEDGTLAGRFQEVLVKNLGDVGRFLMQQQLRSLELTEEEFTEVHVESFLSGLKGDFEKVIGYGINQLEDDLKECIKEGE